MGRKPLKKHRKSDSSTTEPWLSKIVPIFHERGFRDLTMDEVVQIVGVSKATFYKYYSSREKLLEDMIERKIREISVFRDLLFDEQQSYYDRYFNALQVSAVAIAQISNKFLQDLKVTYPDMWKVIEEFKGYALEQMQAFYEEGVKSEFLTEVDPRVMVMMDKIFFERMTDPKFLESFDLTMHEAFTGYFTIKSEGIVRKKKDVEKMRKKLTDLTVVS